MNGSGLTIDQKQVFAVDLARLAYEWECIGLVLDCLALVWHLIGQDWLRLETNCIDLQICVFGGT